MRKTPPQSLITAFAIVIDTYATVRHTLPKHLIEADLEDLNRLFDAFKAGEGKRTYDLLAGLFGGVRAALPKSITGYIYFTLDTSTN